MTSVIQKLRSNGFWGSLSKVRNRLYKPSQNFYEAPSDANFYAFDDPSDLESLFIRKTGNQVHKWHHYLKIYEQHLGHLRGADFRMLEIGVYRGGSLDLWRSYFGDKARIFGIDIDPNCKQFDGVSGQVRIGSQADPDFLKSVVEEMGGVDVVLDDGSHASQHIRSSFDTLFPLLSDGGLYIVEDLHCAYWADYSGGYRWPGSFINVVKRMIDDMHHWYHGKGQRIPAARDHLKAIHIYDSVIVFEKAKVPPPVNTHRPLPAS